MKSRKTNEVNELQGRLAALRAELREKIDEVIAKVAKEPVLESERLPLPLGSVELVYEGGTEDEAKKILGAQTRGYVDWPYCDDANEVRLDGVFTLDQIKALAWWMRHKGGPPPAQWEKHR